MIFLEYVGSRACLSATINGCIPKECSFFAYAPRKFAYRGDARKSQDMLEAYQPLNLLQGPRGERQGNAERKRAQSLSLRKFFKTFLQSRERGDLIVVFVIHCPIDCCDNTTKKSLFRARSTSASLGTVIF